MIIVIMKTNSMEKKEIIVASSFIFINIIIIMSVWYNYDYICREQMLDKNYKSLETQHLILYSFLKED